MNNTRNNMLLTASVLMVQAGSEALTDYIMRAMVGGAVWLLYKLLAERIERWNNKRKQNNDQPLKHDNYEND
jgi:hypothetical protein